MFYQGHCFKVSLRSKCCIRPTILENEVDMVYIYVVHINKCIQLAYICMRSKDTCDMFSTTLRAWLDRMTNKAAAG